MKRIAYVSMLIIIGVVIAAPACFAQSSLGEVAREKRKDKQAEPAPKRVYDNDNLPAQEHINVVGKQSAPISTLDNPETANADTSISENKTTDQKTVLTVDPGQPVEDRQAAYDEWKKKISDQKDTIKLLEREYDVLQREYRLRAAAMYADAGNRLRNSTAWDKEDRDYKNRIEAKQKDLERAKQQLSDMQEDARKAGIPAGIRE